METDDGQDLLSRLPRGCISHILSLTSPLDAVRSALLSKTFKSESESDQVWRRFLPPDWLDIVSRSVAPVEFSSKRELYFRLCDSILIDGGKMSFSVDKMTGKKCFMLSAGELTIIWGDTPRYWMWNPHPHSRLAEVAMLRNVCWLEIRGLIGSHMLSPNTNYTAYLVMGYNADAYGIDYSPADVSVRLGNQVSEHTASLQSEEEKRRQEENRREQGVWYPLPMWHQRHAGNAVDDARIPQPRSDGWVEIELGECYHDDGDEGEVRMSLMETKGGNWKRGIIIVGIEMRPKVSPIV